MTDRDVTMTPTIDKSPDYATPPSIRAIAGRVILHFPPPVKKVGAIFVPETSQLRPEFGEIHDIGEPLSDQQAMIATQLEGLQRQGKRIAVSFAAGVSFWREYDGQALGDEWKWLKNYKAYRLEELAAFVDEP